MMLSQQLVNGNCCLTAYDLSFDLSLDRRSQLSPLCLVLIMVKVSARGTIDARYMKAHFSALSAQDSSQI